MKMILLLISLISTSSLFSQDLDSFIKKNIVGGYIPSAHLLIGFDTDENFKTGGANIIEDKTPDEHTRYDIASLTKVVTALGMKIALYQGSDDLINWPENRLKTNLLSIFELKYPDIKPQVKSVLKAITIEDLLFHKTRLKEFYYSSYVPEDSFDIWLSILDHISYSSSMSTPQYKYRDIHFILLGKAIEIVSGIKLADFFKTKIFQPLEMSDSIALSIEPIIANQISKKKLEFMDSRLIESIQVPKDTLNISKNMMPSYHVTPSLKIEETFFESEKREDLFAYKYLVHDPNAQKMGGLAGHAGVISSTRDLAKLIQALLEARQIHIINKKAVITAREGLHEKLQIPYRDIFMMYAHKSSDGRGEGVDISSGYSFAAKGGVFPSTSFGHLGYTGTSFWVDTCSGLYYVFLTNRTHSVYSDEASKKVISGKRREVAQKVYDEYRPAQGFTYACSYEI